MLQILPVWFLAMLLGVPLFASMGLAAFAFVALGGLNLGIVPQKIAQSANSFPLLAAPLFILMGNIMNSAGITERIFTFATACVGWLRGGLCHANILASVIFAGMSGSAVADAGGVGTLEIKAMKDEGYDAETAAAITAASATIGPIIPPSLPMVDLRRLGRRLDRRPVPRRRHPGPPDGGGADGDGHGGRAPAQPAAPSVPRPSRALARLPAAPSGR